MEKDFNIELVDYLELIAKQIREDLISELKRNKKDGKIDKSLKVVVEVFGTTYKVIMKIEDYFKYIESGRRPGRRMPPVQPILDWTIKKRIKPLDKNIKQKTLAYIIAKSIGKKGIKPVPMLDKVLKTNMKDFKAQIEKLIYLNSEDQIKKELDGKIR